MKKHYWIILILLVLPIVSATPQIIKTTIDVSLSNKTLTVSNEGNILISDSVVIINESFYPVTKRVESIFVREIGNNTDMSNLISELSKYNTDCGNKQLLYELCKDETRNATAALALCQQETGYRTKYETCLSEKTICDSDLNTANNNKMLFGLGGLGIGAAVCYFLLRNSGKILNREKDESEKYPFGEKI